MHSVNLTIKKNYIKSDGTTPIYLQYNYSNSKRTLIKTGKSVEPVYWNNKTKQPRRNHPEYQYIVQYLKSLKLKIEKIIDRSIIDGNTPSIDFVTEQFTLATSPEQIQTLTFIERFNEFIEAKKGKVVNDVIKDYKSLLKHLKGYQIDCKNEITFSSINIKFYDGFVNYLEYKVKKKNGEIGMQKSTVGKLIKNFKVFINHCVRYDYIKPIDLSGFKILNSKAKDIYISDEEIETLLKLDLSDNTQFERIRDLFIIGCETGLRFSDLSRLSKEHISDEYIRITMKKTIDEVIIPISFRLRTILDKYDSTPPINVTSYEFNEHIKTIGRKAKINEYVTKFKIIGNKKTPVKKMKYEFMSSHTCRRSFCTNQFKKGMPTLLIREISGHSDERSFLQYIKISKEEAAQMMLKKWKEIERKQD